MTSDRDGMIDKEAASVLEKLQKVVNQIPQNEFAQLTAAERGTRAHLTLEFIVSLGQDSPGKVAAGVRLAPEVIVDTAGKIVAFGEPGQLGKAAKGFRTIDVALLKSPVSDIRQLIGRNASDVIEAAIDFKTGAAQLQGVKGMQDLIKAPYIKAVQGGDLVRSLEAKVSKLSLPKATVSAEAAQAEAPPGQVSDYVQTLQTSTETVVEGGTQLGNPVKKAYIAAAGALAGGQSTKAEGAEQPKPRRARSTLQTYQEPAAAEEEGFWSMVKGWFTSSPEPPPEPPSGKRSRPMTDQEARIKMNEDPRSQY
jgi:hypothetical protein